MECPQCGGPITGSEKVCGDCARSAKGAAWAKWTWRLGLTNMIIWAVECSFFLIGKWASGIFERCITELHFGLPPLSIVLGLIVLVLGVKARRSGAATRKTTWGMILGISGPAFFVLMVGLYVLILFFSYTFDPQGFSRTFD